MHDFTDKIVLLTGANSGIGKSAALAFAKAGAKVVVTDLDAAKSADTMAEIHEHSPESIFVEINVANEDSVANGIAEAVETFGRLDIGVNNAGIAPHAIPIHEIEAKDWQKVIDINLTGQFYCVKHELRQFVKQGGGVIVNVASEAGILAIPGKVAYVASKHGSLGITKTIAAEYGHQNIRANAICPYYIQTPMLFDANPEKMQEWTDDTPMGRLGEPEEIASAILFFASDASGYSNGDTLVLDGGKAIR